MVNSAGDLLPISLSNVLDLFVIWCSMKFVKMRSMQLLDLCYPEANEKFVAFSAHFIVIGLSYLSEGWDRRQLFLQYTNPKTL